MSLLEPPIDSLVKTSGGKYALCIGVSKRAKELIIQNPEMFDDARKEKPLCVAATQYAERKYNITK